jgi:hypothetical protein
MATTTVYTCDICKQSKSDKDLSKIEVKASGILIKGCNKFEPLRFDICKDCLKRKGFVVEMTEETEQEGKNKNKVTLEDKLYEILEDLGAAFQE